MDKVLTNENYYEEDGYFSVSTYKAFKKCELNAMSGVYNKGGYSEALLFGSYVDSYFDGSQDQFKLEHPEIFSSSGKTKGQLKAFLKPADKIIEFIENDPVFSKFMSGDKQTIMTGKIEGVPFKIKMDSYSEGIAINDLKVMATVTDKRGELYDFIRPYGYHIQLACYQEIVYQNTGKRLPCYICAVTKETPIDSIIVQIPQHVLNGALYEVQQSIRHYYDVKQGKVEPVGCGKCPACTSARTATRIVTLDEINKTFL